MHSFGSIQFEDEYDVYKMRQLVEELQRWIESANQEFGETTGVDVTVNNVTGCLHVFTPNTNVPTEDGTIRICSEPDDPVTHIELQENGVFNDTSFRFAPSSIQIGRDLDISAAAGFIETGNPSGTVGHIRSLIPHIQFEDSGTEHPHTPILDAEEVFDVYTVSAGEIVAQTIGINLGVSPGRVLEESIHEVGSVGSTQPIVVTFHLGTDNTGFVIDRRTLPADTMVANTTLEIDYNNDLGFLAGQQIFMQFQSTANISLKIDALGNPLTKQEAHELDTLELMTNNIMRNTDGHTMLNIDNEAMFARQFR